MLLEPAGPKCSNKGRDKGAELDSVSEFVGLPKQFSSLWRNILYYKKQILIKSKLQITSNKNINFQMWNTTQKLKTILDWLI